jgi:hypothetical protein
MYNSSLDYLIIAAAIALALAYLARRRILRKGAARDCGLSSKADCACCPHSPKAHGAGNEH